MRRIRALAALTAVFAASTARAQEGTLDVLDGETLYQGGGLLTLTYEILRKEGLLRGDGGAPDPLDRRQTDQTIALAGHYGLRYDLQLSAILPYVFKELRLRDPAGPDRFSADGPGDLAALVKWRFYRWDAPGQALNLAVIGGLEFPTGSARERDHGQRLPPDLQPGSGSWDPMGGLAATYEPRRWRFNTFALYKRNTENRDDLKLGDELFAEVAVGNRFWLEPYPGPFMRGDVMVRYRNQTRARQDGRLAPDLGGDLVTLGANLAFRPRPSLDFQVGVEFPLYEKVNGLQLAEEFSATFAFGYRF